jgi:hypothetical protein
MEQKKPPRRQSRY